MLPLRATSNYGKPAVKSWTNWLNAPLLLLVIALLVSPELAAVVPDEYDKWVALAVLFLNLVLRNFVTDEPVTSVLPK